MSTLEVATHAPNRSVEIGGRSLAYRTIGEGKPIVLCNRFRGVMDDWDPLFLASLADRGFRVVWFDYSGLGLSTGERTYDPSKMARDPRDLVEALDLRDVVIAGWSLGGMAAQVLFATHPERVSHVVLLGTTPPGPLVKLAEQLFFDTAALDTYGIEEETILFFEPRDPKSREAAKRSAARIAARTEARSPRVPTAWAASTLSGPRSPIFPAPAVLAALQTTTIPVLHVAGDHDIIFPVENWYALNQQLPTTQLLTYPRAGHGPHHEHPEATAEHVASFVRSTAR
ncbi:alpha/beta fold hydrolase [Sandaracinus amylolyticus]|nr:alpha/beta hydrolase [Sandaracinus amylolyticus]